MFKEPIEILPTVCYTACATLKVRVPNSMEENDILMQDLFFYLSFYVKVSSRFLICSKFSAEKGCS